MIRKLSIFALLLGASLAFTSSTKADDCYYGYGGFGGYVPRYAAPVQVYRPPIYRSPSVYIGGGPTIIRRTYSNVYPIPRTPYYRPVYPSRAYGYGGGYYNRPRISIGFSF